MTHEVPSLRRRVRSSFALAVVAAVVGTALGVITFQSLLVARGDLVDHVDPAAVASERLLSAMIDEENGVRAFVLAADETFLEPYDRGQVAERSNRTDLVELSSSLPGVAAPLQTVDAAIERWRTEYAEPTIEGARRGDPSVRREAELASGRALFDEIRGSMNTLQAQLLVDRDHARHELNAATYRLAAALLFVALTLLGIVGTLWSLVRRGVERPLGLLSNDARLVASGKLDHRIEPVGPTELRTLALAMELMRVRIVDELRAVNEVRDELDLQARDLARSNAELEQFAYVASHDLQEPLRKVASFCQLLESRYGGQLDERADQYIGFAVDGAKRMQALINDLLAFSRVGRLSGEFVDVEGDDVLDQAIDNLSSAIEESGATITAEPLPRLSVEVSLAVALFQNLIGNAIKFRHPDTAPVIRITVATSADGSLHEFAVADDGIGIEADYADRVFVIFQRLHPKEAYAGTGIGLAMSRKIVDYHGGSIWVDPDVESGTTIRFILPILRGATE